MQSDLFCRSLAQVLRRAGNGSPSAANLERGPRTVLRFGREKLSNSHYLVRRVSRADEQSLRSFHFRCAPRAAAQRRASFTGTGQARLVPPATIHHHGKGARDGNRRRGARLLACGAWCLLSSRRAGSLSIVDENVSTRSANLQSRMLGAKRDAKKSPAA